MTDVTIRGIDDDVYSRFAAEAKKCGMAIGELTTEVMRSYLGRDAPATYRITDIETLVVSKADLESMDAPIVLSDINVVEFMDDVDWNVFKEHIERIEDVNKIIVPKSLSQFQVLTKARDIGKVLPKNSK